jgi:RNA polymerase sigma factor (sigma-70 family)
LSESEWMQRLLREFEGALLRQACRYVPRQAACELVQEAFLRLWQESREHGEEKFRGREKEWLFCVCRNMAIDVLKKDGKLNHGDDAFESFESSDERIDQKMEREADEKSQESELMKRMKLLTKKQKEIVRLKFVEGFSYKEISNVTGHSVSHVGVLIHEAMKILKAQKGEKTGGRQ